MFYPVQDAIKNIAFRLNSPHFFLHLYYITYYFLYIAATSQYLFNYSQILCLKALQGILWLYVIFFTSIPALSQQLNLGTPEVMNFAREEYLGGTQSWEAAYLSDGYIIFANNNGLLTYNGNAWQLYPLPNQTILRSIAMRDNRIYAGGQDELGYYQSDSLGRLTFINLKDQLAEHLGTQGELTELEDLWEMVYIDETLYFRSQNQVYCMTNDTTRVYRNVGSSTFLAEFNGMALFNDLDRGIFTIDKGQRRLLEGSESLQNVSITDVIPIADSAFYVLTERQGIHLWCEGKLSEWTYNGKSYLIENRIASGYKLADGSIAIGTYLGGLVMYSPDGKAQYVLSKENGLQSNWVSAITADRSGNLWLGTANGIDQVHLSEPIRRFYPDGKLEGAVYDAEIWNDRFFFATTNGLYWIPKLDYFNPFEALEPSLVANTKGQVWGLDLIEDNLLVAHNDGAYIVEPNMTAQRISEQPGAWKFLQVSKDKLIVGTYLGLALYEKKGSSWRHSKTYPEFRESSRILATGNGQSIWVSHPYRGLYKITFSADFDDIESIGKYQMPGDSLNLRNFVFSVNDDIIVTNPEEVYRYKKEDDTFRYASDLLRQTHRTHNIKRLIPGLNATWYISVSGLGVFKNEDKGFERATISRHYPQFGDVFVGGFENLFQVDKSNIFIFNDQGLTLFQPKNKITPDSFHCKISDIFNTADEKRLIYHGFGVIPGNIELPRINNNIGFYFANDYFEDQDAVVYSYRLAGQSDRWSTWDKEYLKEFNNLSPGEYTFELRAKSPEGVINRASPVVFEVLPAWYESMIALLIYTALIFAGLLALVLIPRKKHKEVTAQLKSEQRKTEAEVERLKEEKLEAEIQFKNQELASTTMHLLQKNGTLLKLKNEMTDLRDQLADMQLRRKAKRIINIIDTDSRLEEDWTKFSRNFDQVHRDFLKRIKVEHPKLTPKDQQLCAYLRMNLNTKEIAPLLNISVRGVEIHRYRLRKKIGIDKSVNLNEFMMEY